MGASKDLFLQYREAEVYRNERREKAEQIGFQLGSKPLKSTKQTNNNHATTNLQN